MPAVAQISVNFAQLSQIRSNESTAPTNVRVVSPRTLTQYLLNNREQGDTVLSSPAYLNYQGGFISAGNKVNVKHDSDLQLRQNLDVEQRVFADSIFARRKGNTAETYKDSRSSSDARSITLAPYETDLTAPSSRNTISITTTPSTKNISLFMNFGNQGENSITLNNTNNDKKLNVRTGVFRIDAADLDIYGAPVYIDETVEIKKETTITDNLNVTGNLSLGTTSYNKFTIASVTGNVAFTGNLNINTGKFKVASATGNTVIAGTLSASGNTSIDGTTTLYNSIIIGTGDTTSATRRIIGVRRLNGVFDYNGSSYDNDAITVGDVKLYGFKTGMIMMWSVPAGQNYSSYFNNNGVGIEIMSGWQICNGQNGSPDLRDRFIVGAGSTYALNDRDGANAVQLSVNEIPAHNHVTANGNNNADISVNISGNTGPAGAHGHGIGADVKIANTSEVGGNLCNTGEQSQLGLAGTFSHAGNHSHSFDGNASFTLYARGGSSSHENRPPFHALFYIIKT